MAQSRDRGARGKRQRICPWCSLTFSKEEHLSRHIRSHTKEKPFWCSACGKSFTRNDTLLRHARMHSTMDGPDRAEPVTPSLNTEAARGEGHEQDSSLPMSGHDLQAPSSTATQRAANLISPNTHQSQEGLPQWLEATVSPHRTIDQQTSQVPLSGPLNDIIDPNLDAAQCLFELPEAPTWLVDEDFDLDALNTSVMESTAGIYPSSNTVGQYVGRYQPHQSTQNHHSIKEDQAQRTWFTYVGIDGATYASPDTVGTHTEIDEQDRQKLYQRLQQGVPAEPLPSTDFLNLCTQLFFTKFNPIFPLVHAPTFRPSEDSALLILSICSIGSLFIGTRHAVAKGSTIFDTLNKAILASWEKYLFRGKCDAVSMIQAALIGQLFAMVSGTPKNLLILRSFHGTVITWAKTHKMFQIRRAADDIGDNLLSNPSEEEWKIWAKAEEQIRIVAGLHIIDAEISGLTFTSPILKHDTPFSSLPASDELWTAATLPMWKTALCRESGNFYGNGPETQNIEATTSVADTSPRDICSQSKFLAYVKLEAIEVCIMDRKVSQVDLDQDTVKEIERQLFQFFDLNFQQQPRETFGDQFFLEVLWHSAFISLSMDFNRLELAVGREGLDESLLHRDFIEKWSSSADACRCAVHGALILRKVEAMPLNVEPAVHVPRALYRAAMVWYAYSRFGGDSDVSSTRGISTSQPEFPELSRLNINSKSLLFEANGYQSSRPKPAQSATLCGLVDALNRVGHWGISKAFVEQLSLLIRDTQP